MRRLPGPVGFEFSGVMAEQRAAVSDPAPSSLEVLEAVQRRVLWLATSMVHHANRVRTTSSGVKVGGHEASSASLVGIMTALYFEHLRAPDRVSVKPHAAPVLHAINYLLGTLDRSYLTTLRQFGGLQSYPSRAKDPGVVDFSTGSVGIGATATLWSAIAQRYVAGHFDVPQGGRHVALVGDAELDEGAIWEALVDPMVARLGEVLWIIDLNRQSLDRVVPDMAAGRLRGMFEAAGWETITVKYGRRLRELFLREGGDALRERIDSMSNEEYQRLLRSPAGELRERLPGDNGRAREVARLVAELDDAEVTAAICDLGGHDLADLLDAFRRADEIRDRPAVIFAYTIKARGLPTQGHPANHSALMSDEQWAQLAAELGADVARPVGRLSRRRARGRALPAGSGAAEARAAARLPSRAQFRATSVAPTSAAPRRSRRSGASSSTSRGPTRRSRSASSRSPRTSPRPRTWAAGSTTPGSGTWGSASTGSPTTRRRSCAGASRRTASTSSSASRRGTSSACWASSERPGRARGCPLLPIGALYDPFVNRALEPWSFGIYAGGQSILVGTPSGVTLAPEGGAHQSVITPSVGLEQPRCVAWEPAFGQDLEWTLLAALGSLGHPGGSSAYFRLSTRPIDQALARRPRRAGRARAAPRTRARRRLPAARGRAGARRRAGRDGRHPARRAGRGRGALGGGSGGRRHLPDLGRPRLPRPAGAAGARRRRSRDPRRALPCRSGAPRSSRVLDGHPHTLAFLSAVRCVPIANLGVTDFGQSGDVQDLYEHFGIDAETIIGAALDLTDAGSR